MEQTTKAAAQHMLAGLLALQTKKQQSKMLQLWATFRSQQLLRIKLQLQSAKNQQLMLGLLPEFLKRKKPIPKKIQLKMLELAEIFSLAMQKFKEKSTLALLLELSTAEQFRQVTLGEMLNLKMQHCLMMANLKLTS